MSSESVSKREINGVSERVRERLRKRSMSKRVSTETEVSL